ncbi:MAG: hypothetical protein U0175_39480 [Caldilineaceae bacterium]
MSSHISITGDHVNIVTKPVGNHYKLVSIARKMEISFFDNPPIEPRATKTGMQVKLASPFLLLLAQPFIVTS